jgi:hypothetical protein
VALDVDDWFAEAEELMAAATYAPALVLLAGGHLRRLAGEHAVRVWESLC